MKGSLTAPVAPLVALFPSWVFLRLRQPMLLIVQFVIKKGDTALVPLFQ